VPLLTLFWVFVRIGASSFGGGLTGWIYREIVADRRWMSEENFLSGVALGQILPGANVVNLALYVGLQVRGTIGSVVATVAMMTPPFVMVVLMGILYIHFKNIETLHFALSGLAAAGVGMMATMGIDSAKRLRGVAPIVVALTVFVTVGLLHWSILYVVVATAPVSVFLAHREMSAEAKRKEPDAG
jgi:chromate transporter